jgi:hypothetical protein
LLHGTVAGPQHELQRTRCGRRTRDRLSQLNLDHLYALRSPFETARLPMDSIETPSQRLKLAQYRSFDLKFDLQV